MAREAGATDQQANALKITNLKDNLREGDVAAVPVQNMITQYAEGLAGITGAKSPYFNMSGPMPAAGGGKPQNAPGKIGLGAIQGTMKREGPAVSAPQVTPGTPGQGFWGAGKS